MITKELKNKLLEAFKLLCSIEEACLYSNIWKSKYEEYIKQNEEFLDEIELNKKYLSLKSRVVIAENIKKWDTRTAMWYLERRNRNEFDLRTKVVYEQAKGNLDNNVITILNSLTWDCNKS